MAETIGSAVARQEQDGGPGRMVEQYRRVFDELLPSHLPVATFVRLSQGLLRRDARLRQAAVRNPESFLAALADCARLGHEPGTDQYALVAFGNEVTGIEQYQGEIERMFRAGAVRSVKCEVVRKNDTFQWRPTKMDLPEHDYDPLAGDEDRGELAGVYAYALMSDGGVSQVIVMGKDEVMRHRAAAKTKEIWDGPFELSMWKKTAVHELEKWVPTSAEWLEHRLRTAAKVQAEQQAKKVEGPRRPEIAPVEEPVDAEVVAELPPAVEEALEHPEQARPRVHPRQLKRMNDAFTRLGWGEEHREQKLVAVGILAGSKLLSSSKDLTAPEAEQVIAQLEGCDDLAALMVLLDKKEQENG